MNILLVRGTSWRNVYDWRVRVMGAPPWHLLTTSEPVAQYPAGLTPIEAARRAAVEYPDAKLYMRVPDPDAIPLSHENLTVGLIVTTLPANGEVA